ncbi:MAG: hypothetical protein VB142_02200 [Burkholderia sp.]
MQTLDQHYLNSRDDRPVQVELLRSQPSERAPAPAASIPKTSSKPAAKHALPVPRSEALVLVLTITSAPAIAPPSGNLRYGATSTAT